ncbi:MAG: TIR domain-containing protein [Gemmatimonadetes bacterium]|nr:TIR domain-containing protein [Gemmatimonadota bacterium]
MSRHVLFSFDLERDFARAVELRGRWVSRDRTAGGFAERPQWVGIRARGRDGVLEWIDREMERASVVVTLVGAETAGLYYVTHALEQAHERDLGVVGIRVHQMDDGLQRVGVPGYDPLDGFRDASGRRLYMTHDWLPGFSDRFLGNWIQFAAEQAGL